MFKNLSLRWKISGPILLLCVLIVMVAASGIVGTNTGRSSSRELGERYLQAITLLLEADRDIYQVALAERTWLSVTADAERVVELRRQIAENRQQSADRIAKFATLAEALPELAAAAAPLLATYKTHRSRWETSGDNMAILLEGNDERTLEKAKSIGLGELEAAFSGMREQIDQLTELSNQHADAAGAAAASRMAASAATALIAGIAGVAVALLVMVLLPRAVVRPIQRLNERLQEIAAGGGDLTRRIEVESNDEIGEMARSFNLFQERLGGMFRGLRDDANELANGVQALEQGMRQIANRSEALADISTANAASIEEITVSVAHISDNSREVENLARDTGTLTSSAAGEVERIASQAAESAGRVRELADLLGGLDRRSEAINGIVGVIREIADQTNLLALNAAIEAARAGEQGRGFAVVADEVRKLAERTGKATVEISGMLGGMRKEAQHAVEVMEQTSTTVQSSVSLTEAARMQISGIGTHVGQVIERMSDVAMSINEQRSATATIAQSTEDITARIQESDTALQQARGTVNALARVARDTQAQFQDFKL